MNNFLQKRTAPSCFADTQLSLRGTAVTSKPQGCHYPFLSCSQAIQGSREQRNIYFAVLLCSVANTSCLEKMRHFLWCTHIDTHEQHNASTRTNFITLLDFFQLKHQGPLPHRSCRVVANMFAAKTWSSNSWLRSCLPQRKAPTHVPSRKCFGMPNSFEKDLPTCFFA